MNMPALEDNSGYVCSPSTAENFAGSKVQVHGFSDCGKLSGKSVLGVSGLAQFKNNNRERGITIARPDERDSCIGAWQTGSLPDADLELLHKVQFREPRSV